MPQSRHISLRQEVDTIRRSLSSVARSIQRLVEAAATNGNGSLRRGRKLKLSPRRRAALKLQGQYMGHLRNLQPAFKTKVKEARNTRGIRAAIAMARRLAKA